MSATITFRAVGLTREARVLERLDRFGALQWARRFSLEMGVKLTEAIGSSHTPFVVRARHRLWVVLKDTLALSYPEVAAIFEVDHSTVQTAARKYWSRQS